MTDHIGSEKTPGGVSVCEPDATPSTQDDESIDGVPESGDPAEDRQARQPTERTPARRSLFVVGMAFVVVLAALAGWLGVRASQSHRTAGQNALFLEVGRQGALNLTTIDWQHADNDVQRILNSATGTFYDDFAKRSQPFIDVVKQAKSTSVGTIVQAGLESSSGDTARVLVAVTVKNSNAGVPETNSREWRLRVSLQKVGEDVKVSNVEFVP